MTEEQIIVEENNELTPGEIKAKELEAFEQALRDRAQELCVANGGRKVIPVWYLDPVNPESGKPIVGFLLEPNRATKGSIMDTFIVSQSRAQKIALEASYMKDVSDARIISTDYVYDAVNIKAGEEALSLVRIAVSQFKKK